MEQIRLNSHKAFKLSFAAFVMIALSIGVLIINNGNDLNLPAVIIGGGFSLGGILGVVGWIYSLKGVKEPITARKVLALLFNSFIVLLFVAFLLGDLLGS